MYACSKLQMLTQSLTTTEKNINNLDYISSPQTFKSHTTCLSFQQLLRVLRNTNRETHKTEDNIALQNDIGMNSSLKVHISSVSFAGSSMNITKQSCDQYVEPCADTWCLSITQKFKKRWWYLHKKQENTCEILLNERMARQIENTSLVIWWLHLSFPVCCYSWRKKKLNWQTGQIYMLYKYTDGALK